MNVYDFDGTIYAGDSTADFILSTIEKHPYIIPTFIKSGLFFAAYNLNLASKTEFKEKLYAFLQSFENIEDLTNEFWDLNFHKIKKWYLAQKKEDDVIISASPEFLLKPVCKRLGTKNLIASVVDKTTGFYKGINCFGEEKVRRFNELFTDKIDNFYSDSFSDKPLAALSKNAYFVEGDVLIKWHI